MSDQKIHLVRCAQEFLVLLKKYALEDIEVEKILGFFMPWYDKVMLGEIAPPCYEYKLSVYFTNPDISSVATKYGDQTGVRHELNVAASNFWAAMCDRPYYD